MKHKKKLWAILPFAIILLGLLTSVRAADLSPLPDAYVSVNGDNGDGFSITGSEGTFTIAQGLGEGNYTVDISHPGYISMKLNATISAGLQTDLGDVQLQVSGRIQGVVKDPGGDPVSGVTVASMDQSSNDTVAYTVTGAGGTFTLDQDIASGTYSVQAMVYSGLETGNFSGLSSNQTVGVTATQGETTSGVVVTLGRSGTISGTVRDDSHAPISNIDIFASPEDGSGLSGLFFGGFATTDDEGHYSIETNLPTGQYMVSITNAEGLVYSYSDSQNVTVTEGETSIVDFSLSHSGIISGTVTLTGGGAASDVTVTAFTMSEPYYFGSATTDIDGNYRINSGLGTGTYMVMAASDYMNAKTDVAVTAGEETSDVDFEITQNMAWITGAVRNSTDAIAYANLEAEGEVNSASAFADNMGVYMLEIQFEEGQISAQMTVTASAKGYLPASQNVTVELGETITDVDFTLNPIPPGTLTGRVVATVIIPEFSGQIAIPLTLTISVILAVLARKRKHESARGLLD